MQEELDVEGLFWLPERPDRQVAGRLRFDAAAGAKLNLIGSVHDPDEVLAQRSGPNVSVPIDELFGWNREPNRILGQTGARKLTLDHCHRTREAIELTSGMAQESYAPRFILSGVHLNDDEELAISSLTLRLRHLEYWVRHSGIEVKLDRDDKSAGIKQARIICTSLDTSTASGNFGELLMAFNYNVRGDRIVEAGIEQRCSFGIRFTAARSLEDTLKVCSALQNLVTIGTHATSSIAGVTLQGSRSNNALGASQDEFLRVQLYAQFTGNDVQGEKDAPSPYDMLFTYDDVGGLDSVARWLEESEKYKPVIDSLVSHWYIPRLYAENRFFNVVTAAESLERMRTNRQNINLRAALRRFARSAGKTFASLVGDVDLWSTRVVKARINHVVHPGLHEAEDGLSLHLLSETVYLLVVLCLLKECGVPADTLSRIPKAPRLRWVAEELQRTV